MSQPDWITASHGRIRQLAEKYLPELFDLHGSESARKIASELTTPETGAFKARIDSYRRMGRRRCERQEVENALVGFSRPAIAERLSIDVSSLSRWFNGITTSDKLEQIFVVFRDELRNLRRPTEDDCAIAGYCFAMEEYREEVAKALGGKADAVKPRLTPENFCYLWVALCDESWRQAMRLADPTHKARSLADVAGLIFQKVADTCRFPSCEGATRKPPETILAIHRKWGLWFRLIVYAGTDVTLFLPTDPLDVSTNEPTDIR